MKDLISRQAAIDAISCDITITGRQNAELVAATIGKFADRIKALPSVQQEITVDGYADGFADGYKQGQKDAQPEIIYCKDCKHYALHSLFGRSFGLCERLCNESHTILTESNDFCSHAERRKQ